ncbi:MAG TPA: SEC-C domain-containing protein [Tissierellia bacterium]|nr:SEC-C domain-containing protein [Tissierellia bacterium]
MKVYKLWQQMSDTALNDQQRAMFWSEYFETEKSVYEQILNERPEKIEGSLEELAKRFGLESPVMAGFIDGINESIKTPVELEELEETTPVTLEIDYEALYLNMLKAKAKWLSSLPQWEDILDKETRLEIKRSYAKEGTIIKEEKPGRNDPCHCGSGKKYKHCHLRDDQEKELAEAQAE